jgi:hypothetical protein
MLYWRFERGVEEIKNVWSTFLGWAAFVALPEMTLAAFFVRSGRLFKMQRALAYIPRDSKLQFCCSARRQATGRSAMPARLK